jgi:ribulose-5-phosphate 4-epimerase/fuculose-1-phosphate aldolase
MTLREDKKELLYWARFLNEKGYLTGTNGNISFRADPHEILINAHGSHLGHMEEEEVLVMDPEGRVRGSDKAPSSEKDLHLAIYQKFDDIEVVIHAHSPFTTAFFHYFDHLDIFSFEAKLQLGEVPIVPQVTPTVTDVSPVIHALENSNIVVLKDHGIVSMGREFKSAFSLVELLEEQAKVNLLIQKSVPSRMRRLSEDSGARGRTQKVGSYKLLSREHTARLAEVINNDQEVQELGQRYDLTCTLAVKNQDTQEVVCFYYDKGKITKIDDSENADFLITGKGEILKRIFNRQLDPFVATTQGKVKTKGDISKMSRWYPALVRTFQLWGLAPVE